MFTSFRSVLVSTLLAAVAWGCGGERVTTSHVPETENQWEQTLGKLAANGNMTKAIVIARLRQDPARVAGVTIAFTRSVSGRAPTYTWSGTTDNRGHARVEIAGDGTGGYYRARAMQDGDVLGSWSSIPINAGYESTVELPVGGKARVTGSIALTPGVFPNGLRSASSFPWQSSNANTVFQSETASSSPANGSTVRHVWAVLASSSLSRIREARQRGRLKRSTGSFTGTACPSSSVPRCPPRP